MSPPQAALAAAWPPTRAAAGCDPDCNIPADNPTYDQLWHCQLSGLPDLNQSMPYVREMFADYIQWILSQYR